MNKSLVGDESYLSKSVTVLLSSVIKFKVTYFNKCLEGSVRFTGIQLEISEC